MELISKDVDDELFHPDSETLVSEDANAILYYLSQMPRDLRGFADKIFNIVAKNHSS